jgi:hypothetical protein
MLKKEKMKKQDRKRFVFAIKQLEVTFPTNLSDEEKAIRMDVFWKKLEPHSIGSVERAIDQYNGRFFPKPVEIIGLILDQAEEIYHKGLPSPDRTLIEYKGLTREESKKILDQVNERMRKIFPDWDKEDLLKNSKSILSQLKGASPRLPPERAKIFEKKRQVQKEKIKSL